MAWDSDDLARSIRRYLTGVLPGPPWTIRLERREVRDDARPVAVVDVGPQQVPRARETRFQGEWEWMAPVTVSCYPELADNEQDAAAGARAVRTQLLRLIVNGIPLVDDTGRNWAGPFRLPLWDYEGVPLKGAGKAGPEFPMDVIWVGRDSLTADAIQDTDDPKRWSVILEFRASIEAPGAQPVPPEPVTVFGADPDF